MGPPAIAEFVEQPAVRLVRVPLAGHVTHVLQSADLLLDECPVPGRFRDRAAQRAHVRPVYGRVPASPAAPVAPLQPQRRQPGGRPAPDQHVHVVRVGTPAQVVQWAASGGVRTELPEHERGDALVVIGRTRNESNSGTPLNVVSRTGSKTGTVSVLKLNFFFSKYDDVISFFL